MIFHHLSRPSAALRRPLWQNLRGSYVSTLANNPHIYVFSSPTSHVLSFLPTDPPTLGLSIGTTTQLPPTPASFTENAAFLNILHSVLSLHAPLDPKLQGQAAAFASSSASFYGLAGLLSSQHRKPNKTRASTTPRGGWMHISDLRAPPDYGRIAWPEDIFGSLEVDINGAFVPGDDISPHLGHYQASGTYRIVTNNGIITLSDYLRQKLVEKLSELENQGGASL